MNCPDSHAAGSLLLRAPLPVFRSALPGSLLFPSSLPRSPLLRSPLLRSPLPRRLLALALVAAAPLAHAQASPAEAELRAQVQSLSREVQALKELVERLARRTQEVDAKAEALAVQQEQGSGARPGFAQGAGATVPGTLGANTGSARGAAATGGGGSPSLAGAPGPSGRASSAGPASGVAASSLAVATAPPDSAPGQVSVFGYGELNYNRPSRDPSQAKATVRRAVLGFGYRFDDRLRLVSEFEFENAVTSADDVGEVAVEQLYLDYAVNRSLNVKAGLFLMPLGLLNEVHEPTRYFGVERNEVETRVIPTTWRELGVGVHGSLDNGLAYDTGLVTGFNLGKWNATESPSAPLVSLHQEGARASAGSLAAYGAIRYLGIPGLRLGTGLFSGNAAQRNDLFRSGTSAADLAGIGGRVTLWDVHAVWQPGRWDLRTLYARGTISQSRQINDVLSAPAVGQTAGFVPKAFDGWFVQAAYDAWRGGDFALKPFARYERYDLQRAMPEGYESFRDPLLSERVLTAGVSLFVGRNAVLKADYQRYRADPSRNRVNLGVGYHF
jgi:hypothetical protein